MALRFLLIVVQELLEDVLWDVVLPKLARDDEALEVLDELVPQIVELE